MSSKVPQYITLAVSSGMQLEPASVLHRITGRTYRVINVTGLAVDLDSNLDQPVATVDPSSYPLPHPPPIIADLVTLGLSADDCAQVSNHYLQRAANLRASYEANLHATMQAFIRTNHGHAIREELAALHQIYCSRLTAAFRRRYDNTVAVLPGLLKKRRKEHLSSSPPEEPKRSTFDKHVLSLLESAFKEEAYPSREVKKRLADQTGMEFKQISDWFQNHRNRSKKQRKELRSTKHFHRRNGSIIVFSPHCQLPDARSSSAPEDDEKVSLQRPAPREDACVFASQPPKHAFPAPYSPSESLFTPLLETPWPRRVATEAKEGSVSSAEVDQLSEAFARLTTIDTAETQTRHSVVPIRRPVGSCSTTCYGFTVVPPKAPLPALQLETAAGTSSRAMACNHRAMRLPSAGDAASYPSSQASSPSTPRRTRKRSPFARDGAHPYSPSSRHSSASSRSSSGSSMYSISTPPDSPLSTPTHKPIDLPSENV